MTDKIVILCTCPNEVEAEKIARALVEARLAACVNIMPHVRSWYRWQGAIESADECMLMVKSSRELFPAVRAAIVEAHSYDVPEVLALPVVDGSENYLEWLTSNLRQPGSST